MTEKKRAVVWIAVSSEVQAADDKESLNEQQFACLEWADANHYDVVKVFVWDGKSRWESDPIQALEDYAAKGWYQYHDLRQMWRDQAFDVLICHNHSRLGRSFTMQSWVIENVIRSGAVIYRVMGGWINKNDYAGQLALGGFSNISEISRLVELRKGTMRKRVERGLSQNSMTRAHIKVRDPLTGKEVGVVLNPNYTEMWRVLADVVLSGVGKKYWGQELAARGFFNNDGLPFHSNVLYKMLKTPSFWGHAAFRQGKGVRGKLGRFAYDKSEAPPPGITMMYDVYPPVYTGALADAICAELKRRETMRGKRRPNNTRPLSGLFVCAECGWTLGIYSRKRASGSYYHALRCNNAGNPHVAKLVCNSRRLQPIQPVMDWLNEKLLEWIDAGNLIIPDARKNEAAKELAGIEKQITELRSRIDVLVEEMTLADASLRDVYRQHLTKLKAQQDSLIARRNRTFHEAQRADTHNADAILAELKPLGEEATDVIWKRSGTEINQFWRALLGDYVIVWDTQARQFVRFSRR